MYHLIIIFICALGIGIGATAAWFTFKRTTPPKGDVKDSERQDALERLKIWSEFWKYFLVSFALVLITTLLSNALKERELALETVKAKVSNLVAENDNLGKFLDRALSEDWRKQYAFASYFGHLTGDSDAQKRWESYAKFIVDTKNERAKLEEQYSNKSTEIAEIRKKSPLDPQLPGKEKELAELGAQLELKQAVLQPKSSTTSRFQATKQPVGNRGAPPDSFLDELIAWGKTAPDDIFAADSPDDAGGIYQSVEKQLGPWQGSLHRRAVMLEVMRVLAGFESGWNWNQGIDLTNSFSSDPNNGDAGAWAVSANSMNFGPELKSLVSTKVGTLDPVAFQRATKTDHPFAMEYVARVLRRTIRHHGPLSRHQVDAWLRRDAVGEFQSLIGDDPRKTVPDESKPELLNSTPPPQATPLASPR
jgi:hypothetical protein